MADAQSAARLRAEIEKTQDKGRQARLLAALDLPGPDAAGAQLMLEMLGARTADGQLRQDALAERAKNARNPTWQGLLWLDVARIAAAAGETDRALDILSEARALGAGATF